MTAPLDGIRVVDFSRGLAGTLASLMLADYGADVVVIEPPGGSPLRAEPAFPLWFRNKKSVALDLRSASGRHTARTLIERADVVLTAFRLGVVEESALVDDDILRRNPGLIHTCISGFGRRGPYAQIKGYEGVVVAKMGGMAHVTGMAPRPGPAFPAVPYASFGAAHAAAQGTLAALYHRQRTGRGQRVDTSLVQGMAAYDPWEWFLRLICQRFPQGYTAAPPFSERGVPNSGFTFRLLVCLTRDGHWLQFSQTSPHLFRELMEVLGLDWVFADPEWKDAPDFDTEGRRERFWEIMLEAARQRTLNEWEAVFRERTNVWAEPFRTVPEALAHPQLQHNGQVLTLDDPHFGSTTQIAPLVLMQQTPATIRSAAPPLDKDGETILARWSPRPEMTRAVANAEAAPQPPLTGVTILELGLWYAAPYGTALLADLGARVIKIEPLGGEPMRHIMPFPDAGAIKVLQGKESVALDLERPEARALLYRIAAKVDLVLASYRGGVAQRLGVDYQSLRKHNPRLVYLNAPGYGVDGPCARKPAFAPTIGAAMGIGLLQAGPSIPRGPNLTLEEIKRASVRLNWSAQAPGNADGCSALGVATALLLGLIARERTGVGQEMLTSMLCTTAYALSEDAVQYSGRPQRRTADLLLYGISALYRLYEAADGWVFLACPQPREWPLLSAALAEECTLAADERFRTADDRARDDAALAEVLATVFRRHPAQVWEERLTAHDVACVEVAPGPVARAVVEDAITRDAGFLAEVEHPTFGPHLRLAPLAELSLTPGRPRPACLFAADTRSVLHDIGLSDEEIGTLATEGVIGLCP
jgi:crotonobetainyl-CoA:carnitine CoA-transferase CaiB-like acyl-CoA transferase